jgi:hypothetical protein
MVLLSELNPNPFQHPRAGRLENHRKSADPESRESQCSRCALNKVVKFLGKRL